MSKTPQRAPTPGARPELARLNLFSVFHLNLAFSSIEEKDRARVIERCYWPLLTLAERHGPIGIEANGFTLEEIAARDPAWVAQLKRLIADGRVEFVGSGYAQIIGPLVPARVVAENLRIGNRVYTDILGVTPSSALVNEQAWSGGLAGHYLDAGYGAVMMDWDNPAAHHADWPAELRYRAPRARGNDGRDIALLWTNTVAFQKLQRLAHNDIALDDYVAFVAGHRADNPRALCIYASDAEVFDFRPGRFRTEEKLGDESEWARVTQAFDALSRIGDCRMIAPSEALALTADAEPLRMETADYPVPVKKQRKYNLTRWSVTGRDDTGINAACERIYRCLVETNAGDAEWKTLCRLWASDFRTHITAKRWMTYCDELAAAEVRLGTSDHADKVFPAHRVKDRFVDITTPALTARLDRRRGLAIQSFAATNKPALVGGLPHGHFDDIALQADWYTGDCVFEAPGEPKVTDLEWAETAVMSDRISKDVHVSGVVETPLGKIEKHLWFHGAEPRVDFDILFDWEWSKGSLRVGHVTLLPDAFDRSKLTLITHNGGSAPERFDLAGQTIDHGAPVSALVSASCGLGMTEGWAEISDGRHTVRVEVDRETAPLLGLLTHKEVGGSLFCQLALSALELDDTRKPAPYRAGPRRIRFSIILKNTGS